MKELRSATKEYPGEHCEHHTEVEFDEEQAEGMSSYEVQKRFPRKYVDCNKCGFQGVVYASFRHYISGDW